MDEDLHAYDYEPPLWAAQCSDMWRQFCLHEYLTWALERLLSATLDLLGALGPTNLSDVVCRLTERRFESAIEALLNRAAKSPHELLVALAGSNASTPASTSRARKALGLHHSVNEEFVLAFEANGEPEAAASAIAMLGVVYAKWRGSEDPALRAVQGAAGLELSAPNVLPVLDAWRAPTATWFDAVRALLELLLRHHDRVMYEKGRLDSCWVHVEQGQLVRDQDYAPGFRASRHEQAVSILQDLLFLEVDDERIRLTKAGRRALHRVEGAA